MKRLVGVVACVVLGVPVAAHAEDPVVKGGLDEDVVRRVITKNMGKVRACHEEGLAKDPGLAGEVVIEFVIGRAGKVDSTVIKRSTLADARVAQCVADEVKAFAFPRPEGGGIAIVQYPFAFESAVKGDGKVYALGGLGSNDAVFGEGGLGVSGPGRSSDGEQGIGVGSIGGLSQPSTAQAGAVVPGKPVVMGSLDKEIIRRVVRQHRNEIRYCYEKSLVKDPSLGGKVDVKFVISATGSVASAVVAQSTVGDKDVEGCIAKKVRRWVFPAPKGGGVVIVRYPFVFTSGAKAKAKAKAAPSAPARRGSLDKSAIQRVVRKHRNEVRYCYENELKKDPELAGMVKVKFVIGVTGSVESASVSSSTVGSDAVGECVVRSISKWVFPAPKGNGSVSVVYPFKFSS